MLIEETVYLSRSNTIDLVLSSFDTVTNGYVVINHTAITRCQLRIGATLIDSNVAPTWFDLTNTDKLIIKLGGSALTAGRYNATLIIYDAGHASGLIWDDLVIVVVSGI